MASFWIAGVGFSAEWDYALSWIGMANTKFLLDLYLQGINKLCCLIIYRYMGRPDLGVTDLTPGKQMFNI
jgi:hypothetical protein